MTYKWNMKLYYKGKSSGTGDLQFMKKEFRKTTVMLLVYQ